MHKAIGIITCASVMAVSLYLFSGGNPARTLSAQTDSESGEGYGAVARRFLQDAREQAEKGNIAEARRLAGTAASLCSEWGPSEQSPDQFLKTLKTKGVSVLLIEQKLTIAMTISDRALVMGHGSIVFQGTPDSLRADAYIRKEWLEV